MTQQLEHPGPAAVENGTAARRPRSFSPALAVATLALTAILPWLGTLVAVLAVAGVVLLVTAVSMPAAGARGGPERGPAVQVGGARPGRAGARDLALHLSPVYC